MKTAGILVIVAAFILVTAGGCSEEPGVEPSAAQMRAIPADSGAIGTRTSVKCVRVIDGDTIEIEGGDRVRFLCVDTPESGHDGFEDAKQFLIDLIEGRTVELEPEHDDKDQYGRLLRYVHLLSWDTTDPDKRYTTNLNVELVRRSYSRYETRWGSSSLYENEFREAQHR